MQTILRARKEKKKKEGKTFAFKNSTSTFKSNSKVYLFLWSLFSVHKFRPSAYDMD